MSDKIDYRIRRKQPGETPQQASMGLGRLVSRVKCVECDTEVCVAQCDEWPPTGPVTLHIGEDWPEPWFVGDLICCSECGGATMNGPDE